MFVDEQSLQGGYSESGGCADDGKLCAEVQPEAYVIESSGNRMGSNLLTSQAVAILGDYLYIEGGELCQYVNGTVPNLDQPSNASQCSISLRHFQPSLLTTTPLAPQ